MKKLGVLFLVFTILPFPSLSQTRGGDIYGSVVLADGSKIPGILVTVTGSKIGKLTTVTGASGNFRFLQLPPGKYELKFELEGFKEVIRKDVELTMGKSVTLDILMETISLREEITITGRAGVIDTGSTTGETTYLFPYSNKPPVVFNRSSIGDYSIPKDVLESIPYGRDIWSALNLVPGVMLDRTDAGSSGSGQQMSMFTGGGDPDDTTWSVDGATITDPSSLGAAPANLNINSYDELQVTLGSNDITAQTGGIQINFVTKKGTNKFSGDFHLYVENKAWEMSQNSTDFMRDNGLVVPGINRLYQYGLNLGGPIIKDKLWWFGSWGVQDIHRRSETDIEDQTWLTTGYGKLNFTHNDWTGNAHFAGDGKKKDGLTFLSPSQQDEWSLRDLKDRWWMSSFNVGHPLPDIFGLGDGSMSGRVTLTGGNFSKTPRGAEVNPANGHSEGNEFLNIDNWSRAEGSAWDFSTNRNSIDFSMDGNYFIEGVLGGDHEIRFGVDYYTADTTTQSLTPNQRIAYVYRQGNWNWLHLIPDRLLDTGFSRISAYAQDAVMFGKLTGYFGVRYDREQGKVNGINQPAFTWYEPGTPYHGQQVFGTDILPGIDLTDFKLDAAWSMISPRISLTYDITGDGKNVVKLSAGRYMSQSGNNLASNYIPYRYGYTWWDDWNQDEVPQFENEVWPYAYSNSPTDINKISFDPDYNTPYLDELTLQFEKALTDDLAVSLTGFYKKRHNLPSEKGIMADGSLETKANWQKIGDTIVGGTLVPTYEQIELPVGWQYYNLDKAKDRYLALEFQLNKSLSNNWMGNFSWICQDWKAFRFEDETLDMNNFDFFNEGVVAPTGTGTALGDIWINSRWMVKMSGMYQLPWGLNLTGFFQAREGNPQPLRRPIFLNQGKTFLYQEGMKSGDERLPTFWMLNLGLQKTFKVTDRVTATAVIDWYNVTNNKTVLKQNISIGADAPGDPDPTMWSNAGIFQFGVRVNF